MYYDCLFVRIRFLLHQSFVDWLLGMNLTYTDSNNTDSEYLPLNDEFIPPTNFAMIENGFYRSDLCNNIFRIGAFPVKRNFPFLRRLGIRSILYCVYIRVLIYRVLVPEEYPEESLKFLKRFDIKLYKYPLEGNKVRSFII